MLTKPFVLLMIGHFMQALGYASMLLLPLYLAHLGANHTQIGAIMASASVGGLLFRPVVGWSLDTFGRKPTLYVGTVVVGLSMGLVVFVHDPGPMSYVQRILFGAGEGALFTGYFTFASDIIPVARRTEGIALFGISGLLPLAVNPLVGDVGVSGDGLRWVFPVLGVVVLASLWVLRPLREPPRAVHLEPMSLAVASRALGQRVLAPVWLATVLFAGLVATFMAFATVVADNRGVSRPADLWFAYAAGAVSVRLIGARLPDRLGPANIVSPALACYAAAALLAVASWTTLGFWMAGLLAGVGHGYCFPVLTSQVVNRAPAHLRGSALAMFTALWEVSALLLTPLFGFVADRLDDASMFALLACVAAVAMAGWAALEHHWGGERVRAPSLPAAVER